MACLEVVKMWYIFCRQNKSEKKKIQSLIKGQPQKVCQGNFFGDKELENMIIIII